MPRRPPLHQPVQLWDVPLSVSLGRFTGQFLYWGFYEPKWWRNYLHEHSFFELCYVYAGEGRFTIDGQDRVVGAGDVFIARPGYVHEIVCSRRKPMGIYFWSHTLTALGQREGAASALDDLMQAYTAGRVWIGPCRDELEPLLMALQRESTQRRPGWRPVVEGLAQRLIIETARALTEGELAGEPMAAVLVDSHERVVAAACRYMQDNLARDLCVRRIAEQVSLSERHLTRLFHEVRGCTVVACLAQLRLDLACRLLRDPTRSVKEVAVACGYPNLSYFTTLFKRRLGASPSTWRIEGGTHFVPTMSEK
ncbi:MAG: helix-turn-helix transcriptional regulator [Phycisphaeraceae bacterium]|nr:helix-turn-helix transcriptional regulator [Phycisphaeraceae bacterium]